MSLNMSPHVTQHDEADISDLLEIRLQVQKERYIKITPLAFFIKAICITLKNYPNHKPKIIFDGQGGIKLGPNANYVIVEGFEVEGPSQYITYAQAIMNRRNRITLKESLNQNNNNYSYFSGWKRLNEKLNSSISALYDLDKSFLTYWRGRLEYKTSGSWVWDFSITQRKGTRKENNTEWSIGLSLAGFKLNTLAEPDGLSSIYSM